MSPSCPFCFKPLERVDNSTNLVNFSWKCDFCKAWVSKAKPTANQQASSPMPIKAWLTRLDTFAQSLAKEEAPQRPK